MDLIPEFGVKETEDGNWKKPCYKRRKNPKKRINRIMKSLESLTRVLMMYLGEKKGENENSGKLGISEKQDSSQGLILLEENYRVIRQQTNRATG